MSAIVFSGPSLPPSCMPAYPGITWRPPARQGDVYRAALVRPALIGIVDGYFETVAAVWHKEILWAMARGIHVYGAASIGALRAAELACFGMHGVGAVFRHFQEAAFADDDEVALLHGPQEVDYVPVTEAMVNVRATVASALQAAIVPEAVAATLVAIAKSLFYKRRTFAAVLAAAAEQGVPRDTLDRFRRWLPEGHIDEKRRDALAMIVAMREHLARGVRPLAVDYAMAHTFAWEEARARAGEHAPAG
jgi:hypothetical protein